MDSEHRHELGENVLARWLAEKINAIKPQLPLILLVCGAVLVGSLAWSSWSVSSDQIEQQAWQRYSTAVDGGLPNLLALELVPANHAGTSAEPWAQVTWADGKLYEASGGLLINRDTALAALDEAQDQYESLLKSGDAPTAIKQRAQFGLGRAFELRGEIDKAREAYEAVEGAFAELAADRAEQLADGRTRDDATWLASARASAPGDPRAGMGARPDATPDPVALPPEGEMPGEGEADGGFDFQSLVEGLPTAPLAPVEGDETKKDDENKDEGETKDEEAAPAEDPAAGAPAEEPGTADEPNEAAESKKPEAPEAEATKPEAKPDEPAAAEPSDPPE